MKKLTIWVIEDNPYFTQDARNQLSVHNLTIFNDGHSAINALITCRNSGSEIPDVILTDCYMPNIADADDLAGCKDDTSLLEWVKKQKKKEEDWNQRWRDGNDLDHHNMLLERQKETTKEVRAPIIAFQKVPFGPAIFTFAVMLGVKYIAILSRFGSHADEGAMTWILESLFPLTSPITSTGDYGYYKTKGEEHARNSCWKRKIGDQTLLLGLHGFDNGEIFPDNEHAHKYWDKCLKKLLEKTK